jgi:hypothetical protein
MGKDGVLPYGLVLTTGLEIGQDPPLTRLVNLLKGKHRAVGFGVTFGEGPNNVPSKMSLSTNFVAMGVWSSSIVELVAAL